MASLIHRISTYDRTTYVDINSTAVYIRTDTWRTTPEPENGLITETFDLVFVGNNATVRTAAETLSHMISRLAEWNNDPLNEVSIWYEENSDGEASTVKRSLITELVVSPLQENKYTQLLGNNAAFRSVVLTHRDIYEDAATPAEDYSDVSAMGGKVNKGTFTGSAVTRPIMTRFSSGSASYDFTKVWCGMKPLYGYSVNDTNTYFDPVQEAEDGTAVTGAMYTSADGNTSPGGGANNSWRVTSVPTSLNAAADWYAYLATASGASPAIQRRYSKGKYLVLGRVKVDAGTVGLEFSYGADSQASAPKSIYRNEMTYISNTAWSLIELGIYQYPFHTRGLTKIFPSGATYDDRGRMSIRIVQISGTTADFQLDCLVLIPSDHMAKASGATISDYAGADQTAFIVNEEDDPIAVNLDYYAPGASYYPNGNPETTFTDWTYPYGGTLYVVAAERSAGHYIADQIRVYFSAVPRYRAYIA